MAQHACRHFLSLHYNPTDQLSPATPTASITVSKGEPVHNYYVFDNRTWDVVGNAML